MKKTGLIRGILGILLLGLVLCSRGLLAATVVLIPGFQAQGMDWRFSQVTTGLQADGWVDGGNVWLTEQGVVNSLQTSQRPENVFYTVNLPTEANIGNQAQILDQYLQAIAFHRQEALALVGHSAGGIVARHWLVSHNRVPVDTLITIASPHLGTPLAEVAALGALLVNNDVARFAEALGFGGLRESRGLFSDLREEKPGTYLYWLNHQPHPAIRYVSVVRTSERPDSADLIVPKHSQDMNNVYSLRNRAERWNSFSNHFLEAEDGVGLATILRSPLNTAK